MLKREEKNNPDGMVVTPLPVQAVPNLDDGSALDFSTLQLCRSDIHSVETVLGIFIFSGAGSAVLPSRVLYTPLIMNTKCTQMIPVVVSVTK